MTTKPLFWITATMLATVSTHAEPRFRTGPSVSSKTAIEQEDPLPAGSITTGGKFSSYLESVWLDGVFPFARLGPVTLFGNLRGTWDDNGQALFSAGLGFRYLVPNHEIILGGNIYYDSIDSQYDNHFDQLGLGAEVLTRWVDARFNYYLPDHGRSNFQQVGAFTRVETGLEGWNSEVGFLVPGLDRILEARLFAGYYHYHGRIGVRYEGWKARAEVHWTPGIITDLEWWNDEQLMGGNWIAGVRVSLPFDIGNIARGRNPFAGAAEALRFGKPRDFKSRLGEPVWRSHRIQTVVNDPVPVPPAPQPPRQEEMMMQHDG
jgi:hypothetical protein